MWTEKFKNSNFQNTDFFGFYFPNTQIVDKENDLSKEKLGFTALDA